jgi:hypothetical protein
MKCNNVRIFFSQIAEKTVSTPIPSVDMNFLANNGYLTVMQKDDYNRGLAEISTLAQISLDLINQRTAENSERTHLNEDIRKTHSIAFLFADKENKDAKSEEIESHKEAISKIDADIAKREAQINELIKKKSIFDRMVPYDGEYISLTGPGII